MDTMTGIVGVAFWTFVAIATIGALWREYAIRKEREKTIRAAIEHGQQLDPEVIAQMYRHEPRLDPQLLLIGGVVTLATGIGLPIMGYFLSLSGDVDQFYRMVGIGCLVALIGVALVAVGWLTPRSETESARRPIERV